MKITNILLIIALSLTVFLSLEIKAENNDTIDVVEFSEQYKGVGNQNIPFTTYEIDELKEFIVFPNPVVSDLYIQFKTANRIPYSVYNLAGRKMDDGYLGEGYEHNINTTEYIKGLYFIKLKDGNQIYTRKFVKQ